jgi:diadenosine tetraphosphate (Ap4A) HIT family hydrolase
MSRLALPEPHAYTGTRESAGVPVLQSSPERILVESQTVRAFLDGYPITAGHALVIPKRHVASIFELSPEELAALWALVATVRKLLAEKYSPDAFNVGVNDGAAAGQTVMHAHIHVIPRRHRSETDLPDAARKTYTVESRDDLGPGSAWKAVPGTPHNLGSLTETNIQRERYYPVRVEQ